MRNRSQLHFVKTWIWGFLTTDIIFNFELGKHMPTQSDCCNKSEREYVCLYICLFIVWTYFICLETIPLFMETIVVEIHLTQTILAVVGGIPHGTLSLGGAGTLLTGATPGHPYTSTALWFSDQCPGIVFTASIVYL